MERGGEAIRETVTHLCSDNSTIHLHFTITGDSAGGNRNMKINGGLMAATDLGLFYNISTFPSIYFN